MKNKRKEQTHMSLNCKTVADVTAAIEEYGIEIIDLRFTDVYGQWHHYYRGL